MIPQLKAELAWAALLPSAIRELLAQSAGDNQAQKLAVGQKVQFTPEMGQVAQSPRDLLIMRQLPETGCVPQYQIKSEVDGHTRVVRENRPAGL